MALLDRLNRRAKNTSADGEMSFVDHLEELRWVILRSVVAALVGALIVGFNYKWFFETIVMSPSKSDFITYKLLCGFGQKIGIGTSLCIEPFKVQMQSTTLVGQFNMAFSFSFMLGFIAAFPYIFYQLWKFVRPALSSNEKSNIGSIIFFVSLLFFLGIGFGYFFLSPYAINFFATFQLSDTIANNWMVSDYISMVTTFTVGCGLAFQLPLALYFLGKVGVITSKFLKKYFRHAIVVIFIVAAIITPPDGLTQIIVAAPLILLYWIGIWLVKKVEKKVVDEWS
jgi:sec-independent protein translocase protein TatC